LMSCAFMLNCCCRQMVRLKRIDLWIDSPVFDYMVSDMSRIRIPIAF
jgi:hypothetical protein